MLLEVVVFNFRSAIDAAGAGADRLEICDNYFEGGTTPSYGTVNSLKEKLAIPLFPMVRPRGGDFLYNTEELAIMAKEIKMFKQLGCEGVVLGCLEKDGTINKQALAYFVELASPMDVTFHRAFDRVRDQFVALEEVIKSGCKRILTSGGKPLAVDGAGKIREIINEAGKRIGIIPGGGVGSDNIAKLIDTGAVEFHTPARKMTDSVMEYTNREMKEKLECVSIDAMDIIKMKEKIKEAEVLD